MNGSCNILIQKNKIDYTAVLNKTLLKLVPLSNDNLILSKAIEL